MADNETNATMFELAIKVENYQQDFYHRLAEMFSYLPEISDFWEGMQKDEIYHARALEKIRGSIHPKQLLAHANSSVLRKTKEALKFPVKERMNAIKTLDDAYLLAHELENSEFNTVFKFLMSEYASSSETKKFALSEIEDHLMKLSEFPRTFGDIEWRKSISAN